MTGLLSYLGLSDRVGGHSNGLEYKKKKKEKRGCLKTQTRFLFCNLCHGFTRKIILYTLWAIAL